MTLNKKQLNKKQLFEEVKKKIPSSKHIKIPRDIDFNLNDDELELFLNETAVVQNMQNNASAFESWAICLRAMFPGIKTVLIDWTIPKSFADIKEKQHFHRLKLRAAFFKNSYPWVKIGDRTLDMLGKENWLFFRSQPVINYPQSKSKQPKKSNSEADIETRLVDKWEKEVPITDHQLPVGLFRQEVKEENAYTPAGPSGVDIWQLEDDVLRIFELKKPGAKVIGIISELMYYANVMHELLAGKIKYPEDIHDLDANYRHIKELVDAIESKKISKIEAVMAAPNLHPLIGCDLERVLAILNENANKIAYSHRNYLPL